MDGTDARILRELGYVPFATGPRPWSSTKAPTIARKLGLSPDVVAARLKRMEEGDVIRGWHVHVNTRHLGLQQVTYHYRVRADKKESVMDQVADVDGVTSLLDLVGEPLCIDFVYANEDQRARRERLLRSIAAADEGYASYEPGRPHVERNLTDLDWRIIAALRPDARRSLSNVAADVGVNPRTVKRRIDQMAEEGAIDVLPIVDPSQVEGVVPGMILCFLRDDADEASTTTQIETVLGDAWVYGWQGPDLDTRVVQFAVAAPSTAELEAMRRSVQALDAVHEAQVDIPCGGRFVWAWMDDAIAARISGTNPPLSIPAPSAR